MTTQSKPSPASTQSTTPTPSKQTPSVRTTGAVSMLLLDPLDPSGDCVIGRWPMNTKAAISPRADGTHAEKKHERVGESKSTDKNSQSDASTPQLNLRKEDLVSLLDPVWQHLSFVLRVVPDDIEEAEHVASVVYGYFAWNQVCIRFVVMRCALICACPICRTRFVYIQVFYTDLSPGFTAATIATSKGKV